MNLKTEISPSFLKHRQVVTGLHCGSPGGGKTFIYPDELAQAGRLVNFANGSGSTSGRDKNRIYSLGGTLGQDFGHESKVKAMPKMDLVEQGWASLVLQRQTSRSDCSDCSSASSVSGASIASSIDSLNFGRKRSVLGQVFDMVRGRRGSLSSLESVAADSIQLRKVRKTSGGQVNDAFDDFSVKMADLWTLDPLEMLRVPNRLLAVHRFLRLVLCAFQTKTASANLCKNLLAVGLTRSLLHVH